MVGFSYQKAMAGGVLSEREIKRICAVALTCIDQIKPDWKIAGPEDGSTHKSIAVMWGNLIRKLREKGCEIDGVEGYSVPATPSANGETPKKGGRKRKAMENFGSDDEFNETPVKKKATPKRSRKTQAKKSESPTPIKQETAATPAPFEGQEDEEQIKEELQSTKFTAFNEY